MFKQMLEHPVELGGSLFPTEGSCMALVGCEQICILLGSDFFGGFHMDMDTTLSSVLGRVF